MDRPQRKEFVYTSARAGLVTPVVALLLVFGLPAASLLAANTSSTASPASLTMAAVQQAV
jgi:hypothetical protein